MDYSGFRSLSHNCLVELSQSLSVVVREKPWELPSLVNTVLIGISASVYDIRDVYSQIEVRAGNVKAIPEIRVAVDGVVCRLLECWVQWLVVSTIPRP